MFFCQSTVSWSSIIKPTTSDLACKEKFYRIRAEKALMVLTFLLVNRVNQVWTFISIRLLIWFDWKSSIWSNDFQNIIVPTTQLATFFLTLVLLRSLKQKENLKKNWRTLICFSPINFTFKITFLISCCLNKIYGKFGVLAIGTNFYITVRKLMIMIGKTQLIYLAS